MKIRNDIDSNCFYLLYLYLLFCLFFSISILLISVTPAKLGIVILLSIINFIILYFVFARYYKITKTQLIIKVGPIIKVIKMKDIKKIYITNYFGISFNTSERCICVETKIHKYYISPKKMDEVLMQLINYRGGKKC